VIRIYSWTYLDASLSKLKEAEHRPKPFAVYELLRGKNVVHIQVSGKKSERKGNPDAISYH
jgi:hypothetical protein